MGFVVFLVIVVGIIATARHRIYQTKLSNDGLKFYGHTLGPRLYSHEEFRKLYETRTRVRSDLKFGRLTSDYRDIAACSIFFPVYWATVGFKATASWGTHALVSSVRETPGEIREREEKEAAARELREQKYEEMYQETERLRKQQEGL